MENLILSENEQIIYQSRTKREIWAIFPGIAFMAVGLFVMFLPLIPTVELAVAPIIVSLSGLAFFSPGILIFIVSIKFVILYKNTQLILTNKKIFVYDKSRKKYKDINLTDISGWDSSFNSFSSEKSDKITWSAKFTFWTSETSITTGKISNCFEMEKALSNIIQVKSYSEARREKYREKLDTDFDTNVKNTKYEVNLKPTLNNYNTGNSVNSESYINNIGLPKIGSNIKRKLNNLLSENEKILCKAEQKKQHGGLFTMLTFGIALSLFFTAGIIILSTIKIETLVNYSDFVLIRNILFYGLGIIVGLLLLLPIGILILIKVKKITPLVLTNEKIIIYDEKTKHYLWFRFNEIISWTCPKIEKINDSGNFAFTVSNEVFIIKKISNSFTVYEALFEKIGETHINHK